MPERLQGIRELLEGLSLVELRVIETLAVILILMLLRAVIVFSVRRNVSDAHVRYHWTKGISYAIVFAALFLVGRIWFVGFRSIATFLGLVAAGLVLALKEPVLNMAGWLFILWRRPFALGDRVQVGSHSGDVIDRRLFQFTVLEIGEWVDADQSTGRIVHIPNGRVFTEAVANYTRGFPYLWNEVSLAVTFESDWRRARQLLLEVAERRGRLLTPADEARVLAESQNVMIFYSTLAPTVYVRGSERGVMLTLRYICGPRERRGTEQAIWEDILDEFGRDESIDFAYPTQRFFHRDVEGRTLRGEARPQ